MQLSLVYVQSLIHLKSYFSKLKHKQVSPSKCSAPFYKLFKIRNI
jgi:hypothetical protein